jgi:Flp pilus assembly protein TadG
MNKQEDRRQTRFSFGLHSRHKGQSAVELAASMAILSVLLVLACDFGRMYYAYVTVSDAARAGAQFGAQSVVTAANANGISAAVTNDAGNISLASGSPTVSQCTCISTADPKIVAQCSSSYNCSTNPSATWVTVSVSSPFTTLVSYPGLPNPVTLTKTAQMQVLQ